MPKTCDVSKCPNTKSNLKREILLVECRGAFIVQITEPTDFADRCQNATYEGSNKCSNKYEERQIGKELVSNCLVFQIQSRYKACLFFRTCPVVNLWKKGKRIACHNHSKINTNGREDDDGCKFMTATGSHEVNAKGDQGEQKPGECTVLLHVNDFRAN